MTNLRVALFTGNYNYIKDGVSLTLNRWVSYLLSQGAKVMVFAPVGKKPAFEHVGELVPVPAFNIPFRPEYRLSLGLTSAVKSKVAAFRPDIVHIAVPDLGGLQALRLARRWNIPAVASYHTRFDFYLRYYKMGWAEPLLKHYITNFYNSCAQTYPPSQSMADQLRAEGITGDMRIWSRGVDRQRFDPAKRDMGWRRGLGIADDQAVIVFAGRLVKEKNVELLMRVFQALERRGDRMRGLIVGDGPAADLMRQFKSRTVFAGFLHGDDVARAYASSELFMFPSDSETFGNVTLEAMACGLPAICADATGSRSLVVPGETGYLIDSKDERAFIETASRLIGAPALRAEMSRKALERAAHFDWSSINAGLLKNFEEAVAEFRRANGPPRLP